MEGNHLKVFISLSVTLSWITHGNKKSTHLICSSQTEDFDHVSLLGGTIVTEEWIRACYEEGERVSEAAYEYPPGESKESSGEAFQLISIFDDLSIFLHETDNEEEIERYIIAYDGDVVDDPSSATHIIHDGEWDDQVEEILQSNKKLKIVTSKWIWDSIQRRKILLEKAYLVKRS